MTPSPYERMQTELLPPTPEGIARAAELLRAGANVAFPTETVYGLGGDALNEDAIAGIYNAKGRPSNNPLIIHVADIDQARVCASSWPRAAQQLAEAYWPGPLTLVVPAAATLSRRALGGGDTVGLRCPAHAIAHALLRAVARPIAAPSANRSGTLSLVRGAQVLAELEGRIAAVLDDAGDTAPRVGIESTVVDLTGPAPVILRPGRVKAADIAHVLGLDERTIARRLHAGDPVAPMPSPGMQDRHYAPAIPLRLVARGELEHAPADVACVALNTLPDRPITTAPTVLLGVSPEVCEARLFAVLYDLQQPPTREIWVEQPPDEPAWEALSDRLRRASHPE